MLVVKAGLKFYDDFIKVNFNWIFYLDLKAQPSKPDLHEWC